MRRSPKITAASQRAQVTRALIELLEQRKLLAASPVVFNGVTPTLPGVVKFANYDTGGKGVSFSGNQNSTAGANYRKDTIGLAFTPDSGGNEFLAYVHPPEWVNYSVLVASTGTYSVSLRVAVGASAGGKVHLEADGKNITGSITLANTGGWDHWTDLVVNNVSLTAGNHTVRLVTESEPGGGQGIANFETMTFKLTGAPPPPPPTGSTPFTGKPVAVPGVIKNANYDLGGKGIAYSGNQNATAGADYRKDTIGLAFTPDSGGSEFVAYVHKPEWINYSVNVATTGTYSIDFREAVGASAGGTIHLESDGTKITGPITFTNTGGWAHWTDLVVNGVSLTAGKHIIRLVVDSETGGNGVANFEKMTFTLGSTQQPPPPASAAYQNAPQGVPGTIEFENYDAGGEGVAYHDLTAGNSGGVYRSDGVDLGSTTDAGGGYVVGWTLPGEFLSYTVNVAASTTYNLGIRVATASPGGTFHVNVDGVNATGSIKLNNTGGWQNWTTINVPNVFIGSGKHVLTLVMDSAVDTTQGIGNFNWMSVSDNPATSPRTQWWRDDKFGMFIHWGLYSQLAGHWNGQTTPGLGEWIENDLGIPQAQYATVAQQFNPTQFNAAQWVQIAKNAGMQYIVLTAKHHDGFSMFNTSVNNYNVVADTPWHQDPVALLSSAAHAAGLKFGAYYSILNWADPNASAAGIGTYMQTMKTQLKELIANDHVDLLWFDGEWPDWWTDELGRELTEYVRNLNPALIINNRIGKRLVTDGDYDTPEQLIPTNEPSGRLWETAMTLNDTWGYKDTDNDWKSPATLINDLTNIVSNGGNYLLNVGPTGTGVIPTGAVNVLNQVGAWLKTNGAAVYGTTRAPVGNQSWGQLTRKGNTLYAIVYKWPANGVLHVPVKGAISSTSILGGGWLSFKTSATGVDITVPTSMPTSPATVIQINFSGAMSA